MRVRWTFKMIIIKKTRKSSFFMRFSAAVDAAVAQNIIFLTIFSSGCVSGVNIFKKGVTLQAKGSEFY